MKLKTTAAVLAVTLSASAPAQTAFPSGPIEIVVPASPGGGWDTTARVIQKVITDKKLVTVPVNVVNRPGAGGQVGWSYLNEYKGNPNYLAMNSNQLFPPQLTGQSKLKFEDFTPIARLTSEYITLAVPTNSPYRTGKQFLDALKADPTRLTVGIGSGVASSDHVAFLQAAKAAGVDVKKVRIVVFSSGGDQMAAVLGGSVNAVSTGLSESLEQAKAGKLRLLAVSSPERLPGDAKDVPTWEEQGIAGTFLHWRGIMAPGNLSAAQTAAWDKIIGEMVRSPEWKAELARRGWISTYLDSKAFTAFLKTSRDQFETVLKDIGLIK